MIFEADPEYACIPCINAKDDTEEDTPQTPDDEVIEVTNQSLDQSKNNISEQKEPESDYRQAQRILKSSSAYDMANILRDVIQHGTGRAALKIGRGDIGGKTGTTNDAKDAWFAGFNGKLVTVAWVGFDQPTTLGRREYGGVAALPIWINFMGNALKGTPASWVQLDKNAKAPRLQETAGQVEPKVDRASPPLARPLYRPAPPPAAVTNDFADLPGEEILIPSRSAPPQVNTPDQPARTQQSRTEPQQRDALENLIQEVQ